MPKFDQAIKEKILVAAEKVFHLYGFSGTRTILIAQEAGISRTMLQKYFNSKEDLFQEVLQNTIGAIFNHTKRLIIQPLDFDKLIESIIDVISDLFEEKPSLPSFVFRILNESPEIAHFLAYTQNDTIPKQLDEFIMVARKNGEVDENITGEDLILNIYALCALPYLAYSYISAKEKRDEAAMNVFYKQRREKIKALVLKGIKP
jgi:TetR/AcrR family transcriptional regulator